MGMHDSSICLLDEDGIEIILSERHSRIKKQGGFPLQVLKKYHEKLVRLAPMISFNALGRPIEHQINYWNTLYPFSKKCEHLGLSQYVPYPENKLENLKHHDCHAYSALYFSPFEKSIILVIDGFGTSLDQFSQEELSLFKDYIPKNIDGVEHVLSGEFLSVYTQEQGEIECVEKQWSGLYYKNSNLNEEKKFRRKEVAESIGIFYENMATYVFGSKYHTGKLMGLASYAQNEQFQELDYFQKQLDLDWNSAANGIAWEDLSSEVQSRMISLAGETQVAYEKFLLEKIEQLKKTYPDYDNLIITGGCALNCVGNTKALQAKLFNNIYVPPNPGDEGISLGAAYGQYLKQNGVDSWRNSKVRVQSSSYGARENIASQTNIEEIFSSKFEVQRHENIEQIAAKILSEGNIIGWFQGRSEIGPRSLGNRSILAPLNFPGLKDYLNKKIKFRESFRPYGGSCLLEKAHEYFEWEKGRENPFMSFTPVVKEEYRKTLQPICHVDYTSRMQTISKAANPRFYELVKEYGELSGVYCLLNTSLNIMGEPIVESIEDAYNFFCHSEVKYFVIEDYLIQKRDI